MNRILLLGAGFSCNWGGWLASQVNEHLPATLHVKRDPHLQKVLRRTESKGGFEAALAEVQNNYILNGTLERLKHLNNLQAAIAEMFADMDAGFAHRQSLDFSSDLNFKVARFLGRFDAIFTLNQDLLLERHYHDSDLALSSPRKWGGWRSPGIRVLVDDNQGAPRDVSKVRYSPDHSQFVSPIGYQPYFKLHGSWNWWSVTGEQMIVLGGDKRSNIQRHPLLNWYQGQFENYLMKPDTGLMVIGYGFGDHHINEMILHSSKKRNGMSMFIVHPRGRKILPPILEEISDGGTSTRPLSSTFAGDEAERRKLMRFFENI
jgi:hypothetical protein